MIPVIVSNLYPFNKIIEHAENGFIASGDDWTSLIESLVENSSLRRSVGEFAFKTVWENFSYSPVSIKRLQTIFI
jgi:hypothetical protein